MTEPIKEARMIASKSPVDLILWKFFVTATRPVKLKLDTPFGDAFAYVHEGTNIFPFPVRGILRPKRSKHIQASGWFR